MPQLLQGSEIIKRSGGTAIQRISQYGRGTLRTACPPIPDSTGPVFHRNQSHKIPWRLFFPMRALLLLLLIAIVSPTWALRGENTRRLQTPAATKGDDSKTTKEVTSKKESKKDSKKGSKKKCKKANKNVKDKKNKKSTKSKKEDAKRFLQLEEDTKEEVPYCLHAEFTESECAKPENFAREDRLSSGLTIQLVHSNEQDASEIVRSVQEILESDTNARFVGCRDMLDPAPKGSPKGDPKDAPKETPVPKATPKGLRQGPNRARVLQDTTNEVTFEDSDKNVDVTGVDFNNLKIVSNGCADIEIEEGSVCDVIESQVDIFYTAMDEATTDDQQQMKDLLVETILSQAISGSFVNVGDIDAVSVDGDDSSSSTIDSQGRGSTGAEGEDPSGEDGPPDYVPYVAGVGGLLLLFGGAYIYGTGSDEESTGKNADTSDDSDEDGGWFGGWAAKNEEEEQQKKEPTATRNSRQVKAVDATGTVQAAKKQEPKSEDGGWFGSSWNKEDEKAEAQGTSGGWFGSAWNAENEKQSETENSGSWFGW